MKTRINNLVRWLILVLQQLSRKLIEEESSNQTFEDLTPIDHLERDEYIEALEWAIGNNRIKNIALTGTYGSGKSSILQSFQKLNPDIKFLNISLASFSASDEVKTPKEDTLNRLIERSILQQVFYTEHPRKIPESRFKKIYAINNWRLWLISVLIAFWTIASILLFRPHWMVPLDTGFITDLYTYPWFKNSLIIGFILGTLLVIFLILKNIKKISFSKLNVAKGEIELAKNLDSSILNKHLDEILYFFEVCKYEVVVFEDIDRFNSIDIFTKLRELNIIINESKQIRRRIKFIYSLRDDMFVDGTRTKFFDFIIPTIPVISSSNSEEMLLKRLISFVEDKSVSKEFVSEISIFIGDMRLLINICNEFTVYQKKLGKLGLNYEKLLAIVTYKNLYPKDFSDLQYGKGLVYDLFSFDKKKITLTIEKRMMEEQLNLEQKIESHEREVLQSVEELRLMYIGDFISKHNAEPNSRPIQNIRLGNAQISLVQLVEDNYFDEFRGLGDVIYSSLNGGAYTSNITFNTIDNHPETYIEREEKIRQFESGGLKTLYAALEKVKKDVHELKTKRLSELLLGIESETVVSDDLLSNRFLFFLVRNGYIDETYEDYLTYFYEGSLTLNDKKFIFSIKDRSPLSYDLELTNHSEIVKKLRIQEYNQRAILNISFIDFLLRHERNHKLALKEVFRLLSNEERSSIEFIEIVRAGSSFPIKKFFSGLFSTWTNVWNFINLEFVEDKRNDFLYLVLEHATQDSIREINKESNGNLADQISADPKFVEVFSQSESLKIVKENIKALDVKFSNLVSDIKGNKLLDFIHKNNLYEINQHMVDFMLKRFVNGKNDMAIEAISYSTIKDLGSDEIKTYIDKNLDQFVLEVLLKNQSVVETEESFINLLNSDIVDNEHKKELITKYDGQISQLEEVEDLVFQSQILENSKIIPNWGSVQLYFNVAEQIDHSLLYFLNRVENAKKLSSEVIQIGDKEEEVKAISKAILLCEDLDTSSYELLLNSVPYVYHSLNIEVLSNAKASLLVENGKIDLTSDNYNALKNNYTDLHIRLAEKYSSEFFEKLDQWDLTDVDIQRVLQSDRFIDNQKLKVYEHYVDTSDITPSVACLSIDLFIRTHYPISYQDLMSIFEKCKGKSESKVALLNSRIDAYSKAEVKGLIATLGKPYSDISKKGLRPKIDRTPINEDFANQLDKAGIISSFKIEKQKIRINTKWH